MNFNIVLQTSSSLTLELENQSCFKSSQPYTLKLNDEIIDEHLVQNVYSIYRLQPSTAYMVTIINEETGESLSKEVYTKKESICLNVKHFNAKGDGITDDTLAIQAAIMSCPDDGRVFIPKGTYATKTIFLKSNLTLELEKGATLLYSASFESGAILPGYTKNSNHEEYYLGSWEGNPLDTFTALIQGVNVSNVNLIGEGVLDGNGSIGWWDFPKVRNVAWRPRLFQIIHSHHVNVQGITLQNSPSWTVHPLFSDDLKFIDLKIINPKDSPNTDGLDPESCHRVLILGVHFSVGDDCIAIKSGKIYLGSRLKRASEYITIRNCSMNFGHGAVVIGSEMAGGVKHILVEQCLFNETDRGLRIKTRRGRGEAAIVEDVTFRHIEMEKVLTPLVVNCFYFCDPDGHSEYVKTKETLPVDYRTPDIRDFCFEDIKCRHSEIAAAYFYGLPEKPIERLSLKDCVFHFTTEAEPGVPAMMDDIPNYCQNGMVLNNIIEVNLENVTFENVIGDPMQIQNVKKVVVDGVIKENYC
ncbi:MULTISPECIES: glycoside hydrolase family 28 protein [Turicibacter]|nr:MULTISPECIES: glycoside hydrolase family 28 protein [Turicibacter]EFF63771.1 polygalacturonase (pectinase) [Turicibacter sanguinis PC909]MCU7202191.1 glycoside hydrolase family 28 protein [Turicibacter sanguinis]MDB8438076.1 glycoside hydrolase family 28 protein [Turicibacter sanguinis]MDB8555992.1 glycoside hydrolase family 28 protein [Turicibacter sanguinis]MDB8556879.1 glycoside hydrolase family 28 protein [Turicibacter sanguinis]